MAFLKFLRFKMKRKLNNNRVSIDHRNQDPTSGSGSKCNIECHSCSTVKKLDWTEIERFTIKFSTVIGTGGFSTVYLAKFFGCSTRARGAVKIYSRMSERLNLVFKQELYILLQLRHENIVKFLGYCDQQEEGALVFEYLPNGNLQQKLHGGAKAESPLSWRSRMAIIFQLAQAIEYLHEKCTLQIVHGDIKSANILLDENLNCKLCDFGSAKMGFSSTIMPISTSSWLSPMRTKHLLMGSPGYTDPYYLKTGIASKKNDIYSFGVVLLELVTGREAFSSEGSHLVGFIFGPTLRNGEFKTLDVGQIIDQRLRGDFDMEEAKVMLSISGLCLGQSPSLRPSITHILQIVREKIPSISFLFSPENDSSAYTMT